jgi:hypothetical protein
MMLISVPDSLLFGPDTAHAYAQGRQALPLLCQPDGA